MLKRFADSLQYLFYRSYIHQLSRWKGDTGTAAVAATGLIAIGIFSNIIAVLTLIAVVAGIQVPTEVSMLGFQHVHVAYLGAIAALAGAQFLNRFYTKDGRAEEIVKEYSGEDPRDKRRHTLYISIYAILTFSFLVVCLVVATTWAHRP